MQKVDPVKNKDIYVESEHVSWTLSAILQCMIFCPFMVLLITSGKTSHINKR